MLDPSGIYTIHTLDGDDAPDVAIREGGPKAVEGDSQSMPSVQESGQGPVLVHVIRGFIDAGSTGEIVADHLLERFTCTRLVDFDADQLISYRARRPTMTFDGDRWVDYEEPKIVIDVLHDAEGTAFLLMHGLEPDVQWDRFVTATTDIIERFDVSLVVGVHGMPMGVPHTRAIGATGHATRSELLLPQPHVFGRVQVPASIPALLEYRLGQEGRDALGFAVHVPHYLAQGEYAPAALEALRQVERATGLDLDSPALEEAARESNAEIDRQMEASPEVRTVVEGLEEQYDRFMETAGRVTLLAETTVIPTAEEIGAEFERFLAEQDQGGESGGFGSEFGEARPHYDDGLPSAGHSPSSPDHSTSTGEWRADDASHPSAEGAPDGEAAPDAEAQPDAGAQSDGEGPSDGAPRTARDTPKPSDEDV